MAAGSFSISGGAAAGSFSISGGAAAGSSGPAPPTSDPSPSPDAPAPYSTSDPFAPGAASDPFNPFAPNPAAGAGSDPFNPFAPGASSLGTMTAATTTSPKDLGTTLRKAVAIGDLTIEVHSYIGLSQGGEIKIGMGESKDGWGKEMARIADAGPPITLEEPLKNNHAEGERVKLKVPKPRKGPPITRLQMIEYLSVREWWRYGQWALIFTLLLWGSFAVIMYLRLDSPGAFEVSDALTLYVTQMLASTNISGVSLQSDNRAWAPCRCACNSADTVSGVILPIPAGPCDTMAFERFNFTGLLSPSMVSSLKAAGQSLDAFEEGTTSLAFDEITTAADAWFWVEHGFLPAVWTPTTSRSGMVRPGLLLGRNLVVGGVRARQVRAELAEKCDVEDDLDKVYGAPCRDSERATELPSSWGSAPITKADDGYFDALFDVERPLSYAAADASRLRELEWLDAATRSLTVEALVLNAEVGVFAILQVIFEFPFAGNVVKRVEVRTLPAVMAYTLMDVIPELCWLFLLCLIIRQELWQLCVMCCRRKCCLYFTDLWNLVDWISIGLGFTIAWYWWVINLQTGSISSDMAALKDLQPGGANLDSYRESWQDILDTTENVYIQKLYHKLGMFWYTVVLTLRFLKGFLGQPKLATIQLAAASGFWDVGHFLVIFLSVFANFVLGGRILFGAELEDWSTFAKAINTSFRTLVGSFSFDAMYEVAPVSATIWFWLFLISTVFLLSNLLLAVLVDHFLQFKKTIGPTPSIVADAVLGWNDLLWRCEYRKEYIKDCECKTAFTWPYKGLTVNLMDMVEMPEEQRDEALKSCLGLKLARKRKEDESVEEMTADNSPGNVFCSSMDLRKCDAEAMTAEKLLEVGYDYVKAENLLKNQSELSQVRKFVSLLRTHSEQLDVHCRLIEAGVDDSLHEDPHSEGVGLDDYWRSLMNNVMKIEESVDNAYEEFVWLRRHGVDTLAPPYTQPPQNSLNKCRTPRTPHGTVERDEDGIPKRSPDSGRRPPELHDRAPSNSTVRFGNTANTNALAVLDSAKPAALAIEN